jgi:Rha family phage regulatory protein
MKKGKSLVSILVNDGVPVVSSREIAVNFDKEHYNVLRDVDSLISQLAALKIEGSLQSQYSQYFVPSEYKDVTGKNNREYLATKKGFQLIAMGFTGQKAFEWKIKYIEAFEAMEKALRNRASKSALEKPVPPEDGKESGAELVALLERMPKGLNAREMYSWYQENIYIPAWHKYEIALRRYERKMQALALKENN